VRFSLQDVKKQVQRRGDELYVSLHFLRPGELRAEIERLITYYERMLGQPQRQFSLDEARACLGDYRVANCLIATLNAWYTWRQPCWAEVLHPLVGGNPEGTDPLQAFESAGITSPIQLRLALFNYVNEHHQGFLGEKTRIQALQTFAGMYRLSVSTLEYLLALDSDEEAVLVRHAPQALEADEVAALYNQWVFEAALANASNVRVVIDCNAWSDTQQGNSTGSETIGTGVGAAVKRLSYLARRLGVYYDLAYRVSARDTPTFLLELTLYGPQEMTGVPQQYGQRLARLCRTLLDYGLSQWQNKRGARARVTPGAIVEAEATVHFLQRVYCFRMDSNLLQLLQLLPSTATDERGVSDISSLFDSSVEQTFAEAFRALERSQGVDGWRLEREPEPLLLERGIFIPDFALTRAGRRLYIEIIGFWTPAYRERKIQKLHQLRGRNDLLLAIPEEARTVFASIIADFPIVWYDGQLSVTELLRVLRSRYDDFAERLASIDVEAVRERVRSEGVLTVGYLQSMPQLLHSYRRSELQRAFEQVVCADIAFAAGVGLYHIDTLEQLRSSFVEWIGAVEQLPLADVLRELRMRWPPTCSKLANCEDATLEALLDLWPEVHVRRTSIFDAVVEVSAWT
jgi:predicted nuclease of restriction endonuclease-like RecB superfamily